MARSMISRVYNTIRAFGGFDSSEVAELRDAIAEAMEEAKVPRGKEAKDNLEVWVKKSEPESLGLGPVSRMLSRHKRKALEVHAVAVDHEKLLSRAIKAVRDMEDDEDTVPAVPEEISDSTWAAACDLARLVEDGVVKRADAVDELHDELGEEGEDGKFEIMAAYKAAFKAARAWKAERVRDARDAEDDEALEALVGAPEARRSLTRGLRAGSERAALAYRAGKSVDRMSQLVDSLAGTAGNEDKIVEIVSKTLAKVLLDAGLVGPKKADVTPAADADVRLTERGQQAQAEGEIARLTSPSGG